MKSIGPLKLRRLGLVAAAFGLFFTLGALDQVYVFWNSPPQSLAPGSSPSTTRTGIILGGIIILTVGFYVTWKIYQWSVATPTGSRSTIDTSRSKLTVPLKIRRLGVVIAACGLLWTVYALDQVYVYWTSPPRLLVAKSSPIITKASLVLTGVLVLIVGLYVTRKIYRWSVATPVAHRSE